MKYLYKFNESKYKQEEEIKNFCEEHLVNLFDIGFKFSVNLYLNYYVIQIFNSNSQNFELIESDLKSFLDFIPYEIIPFKDKIGKLKDIAINGIGFNINELDILLNCNIKIHSIELNVK